MTSLYWIIAQGISTKCPPLHSNQIFLSNSVCVSLWQVKQIGFEISYWLASDTVCCTWTSWTVKPTLQRVCFVNTVPWGLSSDNVWPWQCDFVAPFQRFVPYRYNFHTVCTFGAPKFVQICFKISCFLGILPQIHCRDITITMVIWFKIIMHVGTVYRTRRGRSPIFMQTFDENQFLVPNSSPVRNT